MKKILVMVILGSLMALSPLTVASAQAEMYHIGDMLLFAGNFTPRDFVRCDGSLLRVSEYPALFSVVGTTYGGNGQTTFAVPNMKAAEAPLKGARYIMCIYGVYPSRP